MWKDTKVQRRTIDVKDGFAEYRITIPERGINFAIHGQPDSPLDMLVKLFEETVNQLNEKEEQPDVRTDTTGPETNPA